MTVVNVMPQASNRVMKLEASDVRQLPEQDAIEIATS
jgi:hypothetical protein